MPRSVLREAFLSGFLPTKHLIISSIPDTAHISFAASCRCKCAFPLDLGPSPFNRDRKIVRATKMTSKISPVRPNADSISSPRTRRGAVKVPRSSPKAESGKPAFEVQSFLDSAGLGRKVAKFGRKDPVFAQGDLAKSVMYIQEGGVKLTVVNETGKEAVIGILGPGDFFGEGCLAGQSIRMATATAIAPTIMLVIQKKELIRVLHEEREF